MRVRRGDETIFRCSRDGSIHNSEFLLLPQHPPRQLFRKLPLSIRVTHRILPYSRNRVELLLENVIVHGYDKHCFVLEPFASECRLKLYAILFIIEFNLFLVFFTLEF